MGGVRGEECFGFGFVEGGGLGRLFGDKGAGLLEDTVGGAFT